MSNLATGAPLGSPNPGPWPDSWKTLSHGIRSGRYTDPAFARLEYEKLWSRVWQAAARLDESDALSVW